MPKIVLDSVDEQEERSQLDKRQVVLTVITSAFRDVPFPYHESDITDEGEDTIDLLQQLIQDDIDTVEHVIEKNRNRFPVFFEAFDHLLTFESAEICYVLPRLLIALTFESTHHIFDTRYMLHMLRGDRLPASVDCENILEAEGPSGLQFFKERSAEAGQFNKGFLDRLHLDSEQAAAIISWLEFMREGDELSDRVDEVNGAISFWRDRA